MAGARHSLPDRGRALRIGPETVAAVHHDIVRLDPRAEELLDDGVHRRPRLDEDEDLARGFLSAATNSGSLVAPTRPSGVPMCPATNFSTTAVVRL
jgi:hypothetical protein